EYNDLKSQVEASLEQLSETKRNELIKTQFTKGEIPGTKSGENTRKLKDLQTDVNTHLEKEAAVEKEEQHSESTVKQLATLRINTGEIDLEATKTAARQTMSVSSNYYYKGPSSLTALSNNGEKEAVTLALNEAGTTLEVFHGVADAVVKNYEQRPLASKEALQSHIAAEGHQENINFDRLFRDVQKTWQNFIEESIFEGLDQETVALIQICQTVISNSETKDSKLLGSMAALITMKLPETHPLRKSIPTLIHLLMEKPQQDWSKPNSSMAKAGTTTSLGSKVALHALHLAHPAMLAAEAAAEVAVTVGMEYKMGGNSANIAQRKTILHLVHKLSSHEQESVIRQLDKKFPGELLKHQISLCEAQVKEIEGKVSQLDTQDTTSTPAQLEEQKRKLAEEIEKLNHQITVLSTDSPGGFDVSLISLKEIIAIMPQDQLEECEGLVRAESNNLIVKLMSGIEVESQSTKSDTKAKVAGIAAGTSLAALGPAGLLTTAAAVAVVGGTGAVVERRREKHETQDNLKQLGENLSRLAKQVEEADERATQIKTIEALVKGLGEDAKEAILTQFEATAPGSLSQNQQVAYQDQIKKINQEIDVRRVRYRHQRGEKERGLTTEDRQVYTWYNRVKNSQEIQVDTLPKAVQSIIEDSKKYEAEKATLKSQKDELKEKISELEKGFAPSKIMLADVLKKMNKKDLDTFEKLVDPNLTRQRLRKAQVKLKREKARILQDIPRANKIELIQYIEGNYRVDENGERVQLPKAAQEVVDELNKANRTFTELRSKLEQERDAVNASNVGYNSDGDDSLVWTSSGEVQDEAGEAAGDAEPDV
ncbi:MAG: hypothetical protein VW378_07335, partial [bacterium]